MENRIDKKKDKADKLSNFAAVKLFIVVRHIFKTESVVYIIRF